MKRKMVSLGGRRVIPADKPAVCFVELVFLWGVYCACSCNSSMCLEWRMALVCSAAGNQYLGWVNLFSCQWYHYWSRTALNKGEFPGRGHCPFNPHLRIDLLGGL